MVDRFHRTLNSMLGKVICDSQRDWDERLPLVLAAYTASSHNSTGYSPKQLFLGREVRMPLDLIMGSPVNSDHASTVNEFVSEMRVRAEKCYDIARENLRVSAERRKKTYDLKVRKT